MAAEKKRIALAAAGLIGTDDSIIMTSGTTIEAMAHHMKPKGSLNVVTPSIRVGVTLSEKDNVEVMMLGGKLIRNSLAVRDTYTLEGLKNVKCNKLFVSCDGFDLDAGITTAFVEEARVTNAMMDAAEECGWEKRVSYWTSNPSGTRIYSAHGVSMHFNSYEAVSFTVDIIYDFFF